MIKYNNIKIIIPFVILILLSLLYVNTAKLFDNTPTEVFTVPFHIERKSTSAPRVISGVPLTIYETWHSNKVPTKMRETIYSLLDMNPEFDYYLYSDDACRKFIKDNFNEDVVMAFDTLKPGAYKSDLWRYCILYKKGGIYIDVKFKSLIPLAPIIEKNPEIFVRDMPVTFSFNFESQAYNAFMISPPNNPIFKDCIEDIVRSCKLKLYKSGPLDITGPGLLLKYIKRHKDDKVLYDTPFYTSSRNIFNIIKYHVYTIYYNNKPILEGYIEYRNEQQIFQKTEHYSKLWLKRDIYN